MPKISRQVRLYLYSITIAAVPLLVHFGIIDVEASVLIIPLIVALLNLTPKEAKEAQSAYEEIDYGHDVEPDEVPELDAPN